MDSTIWELFNKKNYAPSQIDEMLILRNGKAHDSIVDRWKQENYEYIEDRNLFYER